MKVRSVAIVLATERHHCRAQYFDLSPKRDKHEYTALGLDVTYTAHALVIEYVLDDTSAALTPVFQHVSLTPDGTCAAPAPVIKHGILHPILE